MILNRLNDDGKALLKLNALQRRMRDQVIQKLEDGTYKMEEIECEICSSKNSQIIGSKDRYGLPYVTNLCEDCGVIYTNPRMTQDSYNSFYNIEYRKLYVGTKTATSLFFERQQKSGKRIYDFIQKHCNVKMNELSVLEIGCGAGGILDYFKDQGCVVEGVDLGEEYINFGINEHELNLRTGFLKDCDKEVKRDIIIYSHVMEHILDLNEEIALIKEFTHPNSIIYIEVPGVKNIHLNYDRDILKYFQNAHTFHFTKTSLTNLMGKQGFELIYGNEFVMAAFGVDGKSRDLENDYFEVLSYIRSTEKGRKYFFFTRIGFKIKMKNFLLKTLDLLGLRKIIRKIGK